MKREPARQSRRKAVPPDIPVMKERAMGIFGKVYSAVKEAFLFPIKLYRRFLSPLKGSPSCRFTPTCSEYAILAVREWGIIIGMIMALVRVIRCNPFSDGGEDPVPSRKEFLARVKALFNKGKKQKTDIGE